MTEPGAVTVIKRDILGRETFRYNGIVLERCPKYVRLEARFNREDLPVEEVVLKRNDRFLETYYTQRWYNIFEIFDRDTGALKAWYCNVGYPAEVEDTVISYRDLALDLLVYPDGRQVILDQDEFEQLEISPLVRQQALTALKELEELFKVVSGQGAPFPHHPN
jgi:predicted RNA-binding protein associated with RNAse of E/G family